MNNKPPQNIEIHPPFNDYCTFDEDINLMANNNKNGFETPVILVQGTPVLPVTYN